MRLKSILALSLISCLFPTAFAQIPQTAPAPKNQPPSQPSQQSTVDDQDDVVKITTNLVQVDAVVKKDGKVVRDLKAEDFEIFEDSRKQEITSFAYISNLPAAPSSPVAQPVDKNAPPPSVRTPRVEDPRRIIALVVDDLGLSAESMSSLRPRLRKFLNETLPPNDLVAIIRTSGTIGALQQFTTDRRLLDQALSQIKWNICSRVGFTVLPRATHTIDGNRIYDLSFGPCGRNSPWSQGNTMQTLQHVVEAMGEMPGRKSMIVFSDSLPEQEQDFTAITRQGMRPTFVPTNMNASSLLRTIAEKAIRSSVVIYSVDASGLQFTGPTAADKFTGTANQITEQMNRLWSERSMLLFNRRAGADLIARQTGGFLVQNANDFGLNRIMEDQSGYYLIGYRPTDETFNRKFHHIKAKVKKSGMSVRTRFGFFGVSEEEVAKSKRTPGDKTEVALLSPFGAQDLTVELTGLFANRDSGPIVRAQVFLNTKDLTFRQTADGSHQTSIQLRSMIVGSNTNNANYNRDITLSPELYEKAEREGLLLHFDMPLRITGNLQIGVAVRDIATSRIGTAREVVFVPNLRSKQLALSGILMGHDKGTPEGFDIAIRRFRAGASVRFACEIYNAIINQSTNKASVMVQAHIYRDGKRWSSPPITIDASNPNDRQPGTVSAVLPLNSDLQPGNYYLKLVAKDLLGKEKTPLASQWIDFEIVK